MKNKDKQELRKLLKKYYLYKRIIDMEELKGKFEEGVRKHYEQQDNVERNE